MKLHPAQKRFLENGGKAFFGGMNLRTGRREMVRAVVVASAPTAEDRDSLLLDLEKHGWAMQGPNGEHVPIPTRNGSLPIVFYDS